MSQAELYTFGKIKLGLSSTNFAHLRGSILVRVIQGLPNLSVTLDYCNH